MTLFDLLKEGCTITFPSGYMLIGDPSTSYIDTKFNLEGHIVGDGLRVLSTAGAAEALQDARKYAEHKSKE